MQQRNPFDAFDQPARRGMVIQSGPPADPSKEPMTRAQLVTEQARAANADAQQRAQTRIDNANADAKERDNRDAAADAAAAAAGTKMGPNSQLTGDAYLRAFVPPSQWEVVKSFARGDAGARQGINKTTLPIIQHAMNYDHSFSMANYPARALMTADLASHAAGSMGNYLSALGAVAAHSRLEESAIGGLDNPSGVVGRYGGASLNNYFNNEGAATGSAFHTANQTFADEKVKAILASGPGAVADREAAVKEVQPTMAKDAQYASLRTTARQIYDKYQEQELKYSRIMGGQSIPMPMRQEDAAQLLHLMRLGDDGKEGSTPKDIDPKFLAFATGATPTVGGLPPADGGQGSGPQGGNPAGPRGSLATGDTKSERDPVRETAISNMFRAMVASGKVDPQAISAANVKMGGMPISPDDVTKMTAMVKGGFTGNLIDTSVSTPTSLLNRFAASPTGTALGGALDAGMGGMSDEFASLMGGGDLADLNARKQAAFAANPKSAAAGQLAGSLLAMAGIGKLGTAAGLAEPALAADLGYGAASGAGQDNDNRIAGALIGTATSAAGIGTGALLAKPIGALARTAAGSKAVDIARLLADKIPGVSAAPIPRAAALTPAEQSLSSTITKAGTDKVTAALANGSSVNAPFTLADSAPSLGELAGAAVRRSPAAREFAEPVLAARSQGQIGRMGDAVEQNLGPIGNTLEISRLLSEKARTDAAPLYDAYRAQPAMGSDDLDAILNTPFGQSAIGKARTIAANEGRNPQELGFALDSNGQAILNPQPSQGIANSLFARQELDAAQNAYRQAKTMPGSMDAVTVRLERARQGMRDASASLSAAPDPSLAASTPAYTPETLDYAKRGMDSVLEQYRNPLTQRLDMSGNPIAQSEQDVRQRFVSTLDGLNPYYKPARDAFAGPMQSRDALALGQDLYGSSVNANQVAASIADKTPEHLAQAQLGYRDAMMDRADKLSYATNPWNTLNTPAAEAKLSAMYPDSDGVAALLNQRDVERQMASTNTRVIGGSQTAPRQISDQQFMPGVGASLAIDGATAAMGGVPVASVTRALMGSKIMDGVRLGIGRQADAKAEALIPMLLNTDPDASAAIVQNLMDKSAAYDAYRKATTPGGVFSQLGAGAGVVSTDAMVR